MHGLSCRSYDGGEDREFKNIKEITFTVWTIRTKTGNLEGSSISNQKL